MGAEGEECEGNEGLGSVESVGDAGKESDLGVGRFDEPLGQVVFEVGVDRMTVSADLLGEVDKGGEL